MEKQEKVFVDGMRFELPNEIMKEKTPWIKAKISFKVPEMVAFLEKHQSNAGWVNVDLKKSDKTGNMYLELNNYKKPETKVDPNSIGGTTIDPMTGRDLTDSPF